MVEDMSGQRTQLQKIQQELLSMLKDFDQACKKNGIEYSIHGGTMLGAVRHHGFIPWDDDVDITMTSETFDRFKQMVQTDMPDYWISDDVNVGPRLLRKEYGDRPIVWLDLLEYNYISEKRIFQKTKIGLLMFLSGLCRTEKTIRNATVEKHGRFKIILLHIIYYFGKLFPLRQKLRLYRFVGRKMFLGKKTLIHRSNDQAKALRVILPAEYMEAFEYLPFEDTELMVSKHYAEMLISDFGPDYMTPPPVEARTPHDNVIRSVCEDIQREYEKKHVGNKNSPGGNIPSKYKE